jgi:hypothetical protein
MLHDHQQEQHLTPTHYLPSWPTYCWLNALSPFACACYDCVVVICNELSLSQRHQATNVQALINNVTDGKRMLRVSLVWLDVLE